MINEIIEKFEPEVTGLPWVQRYGGLAKPVRIVQPNVADRTVAVAHYISTPSDSDQTKLLAEKRYKFLVPDKSVKSIMYFEQPQSEVLVDGVGKTNYCRYQTDIKLIAWLNLKKIGVEQTTIKGRCMQQLVSIFNQKNWGSTASAHNIKTSNVTIDNDAATLALFAKYSYGDSQYLHFYPYEVLSITIPVRYTVYLNCLDEINITNIDCVKYEN